MSVCLSVGRSVGRSVSAYLSIYLSIYQSIYLSIILSIYISICLSLSLSLSIYLSMCVIHKTEWTILDKAKPCPPATRKCDLCLTEKYHILLEKSRLLNKRSENLEHAPTEKNTSYKIRIGATKKIRPDECISAKQICC